MAVRAQDTQTQDPPPAIRLNVLGQAVVGLAAQPLALMLAMNEQQSQPGMTVGRILPQEVGILQR